GQRRYRDELLRDHGRRKAFFEEAAKPVGIDVLAPAVVGDEPGGGCRRSSGEGGLPRHEHPGARALDDRHGAGLDRGVELEHGLDLVRLDPYAAQLDQPVDPAEEQDLAVSDGGGVAGAIDPPGRALVARVAKERPARLLEAAEVAAADGVAADEELAAVAGSARAPRAVLPPQDIGACVRDRPSDRPAH